MYKTPKYTLFQFQRHYKTGTQPNKQQITRWHFAFAQFAVLKSGSKEVT